MALWRRLAEVLTGRRRDPAVRADAERVLLESDLGVTAVEEILDRLEGVPDEQLPVALEEAECVLLAPAHPSPPGALARAQVPPTVMLILGVNGVGKTTTIAKLAWRLQREGRSVLASCA
ncbi:MAG: hypothetical protein ACREL9_12745 [Gemmatimonadales bacterium]